MISEIIIITLSFSSKIVLGLSYNLTATVTIILCKKKSKLGTLTLTLLESVFNLTHARILTWLIKIAVIKFNK